MSEVEGGVDVHTVDLSQFSDFYEGIRVIGNPALCDYVDTVNFYGLFVGDSQEALKECPLKVVALNGQCVNDFDFVNKTVHYYEAGAESNAV